MTEPQFKTELERVLYEALEDLYEETTGLGAQDRMFQLVREDARKALVQARKER